MGKINRKRGRPNLPAIRRAAHALLRGGKLAPFEIARELGTARQLVRYWAQVEGINYRAARAIFIRKTAAAALRKARGKQHNGLP